MALKATQSNLKPENGLPVAHLCAFYKGRAFVDIGRKVLLERYKGWRRERGIRTLDTGVSPYNGLAILGIQASSRNPNHLHPRSNSKQHPKSPE